MSVNSSQCDQSRIVRFLSQDLGDGEQELFEQHLEQCESCRMQLEEQTATSIAWYEANKFLHDEPFELEPLSTLAANADSTDVGEQVFEVRLLLDSLAPTDDPRMLGRVGPYEVAGVIGTGGMGAVLKGYDQALNRYVAIKMLAPHLASSGAAKKRFAREAQAAAAVVHDNVIEIHGVAEMEGSPYLVMKYVRGPSLQKRLDETGPCGVAEVLRVGMQTAAGLAAAHAQGLVHRDVKPGNILLADGIERVKLTDFGLARAADDASLTHSGVIAGTPQFMSPEQAEGKSVDQRSDLFSLGSVLYNMCTGHPPFRADTSFGVLRRISEEQPRPVRQVNPDVPVWLESIIQKLHAKSPDDRYQSATEVADLMAECLAHIQQPQTVQLPQSVAELSQTPPRRPLLSLSTLLPALAATLLIGAFAVWIGWGGGNGSPDEKKSPGKSQPATKEKSEQNALKQNAPLPEDLEWNDGVDQKLKALTDEAGQLKQRTRRLLDNSQPSQ